MSFDQMVQNPHSSNSQIFSGNGIATFFYYRFEVYSYPDHDYSTGVIIIPHKQIVKSVWLTQESPTAYN